MAIAKDYNLRRVLEMRERAREAAAANLAAAQQQLSAAENELRQRETAVEDCRREQIETFQTTTEKSRNGIRSSEIQRFRQHSADLRERETQLLAAVEEQKFTVARQENAVAKALEALNEAAKELKVIEKHRENWQAQNRLQAERREQKSNDEIGAILHERHKLE